MGRRVGAAADCAVALHRPCFSPAAVHDRHDDHLYPSPVSANRPSLLVVPSQAPICTMEKLLLERVSPPSRLRNSQLLRALLTKAMLVPFAPLFMAPLEAGGVLSPMEMLGPRLVFS